MTQIIGNAPIADLQMSDLGFTDPAVDPRAPSFFIQSAPGVLFVSPGKVLRPSKSSDHGGFSDDDTHVGTFVFWQGSGLIPGNVTDKVVTAQVRLA